MERSSEHLLARRRTKIVATIGPASADRTVIDRLLETGVDVFRLNMSHGDHEQHRCTHGTIRQAAREAGRSVAVLADLCGPKIRVGRLQGGAVELEAGRGVTLTTHDVVGTADLVPSQYPALTNDVRAGDRVLLDDGNLELSVQAVQGSEIRCQVVVGGTLKDHKGINLPGALVSAPSLTDKDREDARFAVGLGVDLLALSFVRRAADVLELRELLRPMGRATPLIAKIEKPQALDDIDAILDASDAIMVARGDLGVELPPERVPAIQEELVDRARARCRPAIVATQMLESMISSPRPTRAEATDVANAVRSGADALMLSGETAAGAHPVEAVRMMDLIVRQTETQLHRHGQFGAFDQYTPTPIADARPIGVEGALARAVALLSRELGSSGIVAFTESGTSMAVLASSRPAVPVVAVTSEASVHGLGCLTWGVIPVLARADGRPEDEARRLVRQLGLETERQGILLVRGFGSRESSVTVLTA